MRINALMALAAAAIFVASPTVPAGAQIYQYFDKDGTLVITDSPHGAGKKVRTRVNKLPRPAYTTKPDGSYHAVPGPRTAPNVTFRDDVTYEYYGVSGSNTGELADSARENGPYDADLRKSFPAQTRWNLGWSYNLGYKYRIAGGEVVVDVNIKDVDFISDIVVILPSLMEDVELSKHDATAWDEYFALLLEHEHDHVAIIRDPKYVDMALAEIGEITELTLPYEPGADLKHDIRQAIQEETELVGRRMSLAIKSENDQYDSITVHGNKHEMRTLFGF